MGPQPEPPNQDARLQELQLRKALLENEKLRVEIHNLKRRWTGTLIRKRRYRAESAGRVEPQSEYVDLSLTGCAKHKRALD